MSQRPSLGSSTSSSPGTAAAPGTTTRLGRPALAPRKSLIALRQSAANSSPSPTSPGFATPPLPSLPSANFASSAITPKRPSLSHAATQSLDIGDLVSVELPGGSRLTGVLRHLGPVHFKEGNYAGLELVGDSFGKGKNNGEVQGRQYFATQPNNGMFCPASKVIKLSQGPATDAVARPESALSHSRSQSRSASRMSETERPASRISNSTGPTSSNAYTPVRSNIRARSNTANSYHQSESSSRPSSRVSVHHERTTSDTGAAHATITTPGHHLTRGGSVSSSSAGVPGKLRTPSATSTPGSKLPFSGRKSFGFGAGATPASRGSTPAVPPVPRPPSVSQKSRASSRASSTLEDDQAEADSERRAKTSAEAAARAERMISVGSRAHRFLGLRARDLNGQQQQQTSAGKEADEVFGGSTAKSRAATTSTAPSSSGAGRTSPTKGRPSSPLKATLLGRPSLGGSNNTPTAPAGGLEALRKARASLPNSASALPTSSSSGSLNQTPRPAKGRQSLFSYNSSSSSSQSAETGSTNAMPPPPSPSKLGGLARSSLAAQNASPTRSSSRGSHASESERPTSAASNDGSRSGALKLGPRSAFGAGAGPHTPVKGASGGGGSSSLMSPPVARTSLRPSLGSHSSTTSSSYVSAVDDASGNAGPGGVVDSPGPGDTSLVRRHRLLEEMDLTPKRPGQSTAQTAAGGGETSRSNSRLSVVDSRAASAQPSSPGPEFVAQASVPLSLYEEAQQELERLTGSLAEAERKATAERAVRTEEDRVLRAALDSERARVKEDKEEWEEERRLLRADEERRKRDAENREKELKESIAKLKRDLDTFKDLPREIEALKAELGERDRLADELKKTIEERDQGKAEESGKVKIMEAEMKSAEEKMKRIEAEHKSEVEGLQKEVDDLKAAGTEMLQLFDTRVQELRDELREEIETDYREDMRKTLRDLAAVEAERDALVHKREAEAEERTLANGRGGSTAGMAPTAITIENESLREQLSHLQEKVGSLEEELALANVQAETEREAVQHKGERLAEKEANLQAEIKKLKAEVERVNKGERAARQRIDDLNDVVEESKTALETERAEVERLRADLLSSSGNGLNAPSSGSGAPQTPTLQDEAMQERAKRAESEKAKLEAEVDRLTRLLDGARSGKKEAVRVVEELRKSVDDKLELIEDVRRELSSVEAERTTLERKVAQGAKGGLETEGSAILVRSLRRTIDDKNKEVEMLKRTHMPLSDQLLELRKIHSEEISLKDEELRRLRTSLASVKASSRKLSDGPMERRALSPVVGQQVAHSSDSTGGGLSQMERNRPLSISSIASRTSRGSIGELSPDSRSDNHMVANQVSGLNYLVRQLTDENAKVKSQFRLLEQQSKEEVEEAKSEARVSALTLESLREDVDSLKSGDNKALDLFQLRTEFSQRTASLEKQVQDAREEITRLQASNKETDSQQKQTLDAQAKEISDLEHLIESQIYKLDEKEEMYERLHRRLDRANMYIDELRAALDSKSPGVAAMTPHRRSSDAGSQGTAKDEEDSPSQTQALRLRKTSGASGSGSSNQDTLGSRPSSSSIPSISTPSESLSSNATPTLAAAAKLSSARNFESDDDDDDEDDELENFCVLCNTRGHSVVNCTSDLVRPASVGRNFDGDDDICDDCGEKGHKLEDCPYADVF